VVVYKVDRMTRSLADFGKLVEQFDKFGVSFVSVTQQFNTTSSMGRLTLNVLLSFAQFEREVTGERIRDKIAASKKKGMWMGGNVPLGYTAQDRKLVVNEPEAVTVRTIFNEFLRLGSVHSLQDWLRENNIKSRRDNHFFRGALYMMLRNPHYIGLIKHKKESYPGKHAAIINRETWDKVQTLLDENIQGKRRKVRATKESLLTGILFDSVGTLYTPTHANKKGRRYRYYTSQAVIKKIGKSSAPARIPAHDLEKALVDRLLEWLQTPTQLLAVLHYETTMAPPEGILAQIIAQATAAAERWRERITADRTQFLKTAIERVVIQQTHVEIRLRVPALLNEILGIGELAIDLPQIASIECPFRHVRQGRAVRLVVGDTNITTDASRKAILKAIARSRLWYLQITTGQARSVRELAGLHCISPRFVNEQFKLITLSPQSIEGLITRPESLRQSLNDMLNSIPINWREQPFGLYAKSA
jgi:DNA invertase Pin-like site-specific DNA recombinase